MAVEKPWNRRYCLVVFETIGPHSFTGVQLTVALVCLAVIVAHDSTYSGGDSGIDAMYYY